MGLYFFIVRHHIRERVGSWRHLGFILDLYQKFSAGNKKTGPVEKVNMYHGCLDVLLEELKYYHKNPPMMRVTLGNQTKLVKQVHFPISFVWVTRKAVTFCVYDAMHVNGCIDHACVLS
jgi:hypothetical protein